MKLCTLAVPCLCALVVACAPSVNITKVDPEKQQATVMSPTEDQVPFAIRSSDLYLAPAGASSSGIASGNIKLSKPCNQAVPTNQVDYTQAPPIADWKSCLDGMQIVATPTQGPVYLATAGDNTTLAITSVDGDPLLLKSLTITKTHTLSNTVTSMGADVAAGVAVGGPLAIGVGSAAALYTLGEAAGVFHIEGNTPPLGGFPPNTNKLWTSKAGSNIQAKLCQDSTDGYDFDSYHYDDQPVASLTLPITAPVTILESATAADDKGQCWTPLPGILPPDSTTVKAYWFYRVVATDADPTTAKASEIEFPPTLHRNKDDSHGGTIVDINNFVPKTGPAPNQFPTSACRTVEVDIVWWQALDEAPDKPTYAKYKMTVADPGRVQVMNIPDQAGELINFNPICGAYISNTTAPAASTDFLSALIQAAQTVKKAEPTKGGGS